MLDYCQQNKEHYVPCNAYIGESINIYPQYRIYAALLPFTLRQLTYILALLLGEANKYERIAGIDLHLADDCQSAEVNWKFFNRLGPTNIISFPQKPPMSGILFLSLDTYARECIIYGQSPRTHLIHLLSHGVGHLAGYDHGPQMDALCANCMQATSLIYD